MKHTGTGFKTHRYNIYIATVSDQNKQDAENEDNIKVPILKPKLENVLKNSAIQQGMQNKKERMDKVMTNGNRKTTHKRSKLIYKCELSTFKTFKLYQLKQYVRIHTKKERKDKVMRKGNPKTTHNRSNQIVKC